MVDDAPRILAGRYEVGELIGRGGMAEVHIGHDNRLGRTVAIKILRSDLARDPSFQARFRREAQAAASLNHPAVVAVYDTGEDTLNDPATGASSHVPFIVMEYVEGHTVRDILRDGNAVPIAEAVEITVGVLSALEYSHRAGIVHRDIKPANVMITPTGAIKVMDFGIARALADSAATMTQTQAVIGTAQYLSPEQARGEPVDARSDIYSTGCLLFELLTGRPPFIGDSPVSVAYQHVRENPATPSALASDVPEALDRITLKSLAKDREQRYQSAGEFRADLESFVNGSPVGAIVPAATAATEVYAPVASSGPATQVLGGPISGPPTQATPTWGTIPPQAEEFDPEDDEDEGNRRKALIWTLAGIAVLAIVAIIFILVLGNGKNEIQTQAIPTVVNLTEKDAKAALLAEGFTATPTVTTEASTEIDKGHVISIDPAEGTEVAPDAPIALVVSGGPNAVEVPNVTGLDQTQAEELLISKGLVVASNRPVEDSADVAKDKVTRAEPEIGSTVEEGDEITLFVSNGFVTLEDMTGKKLAEAQETLGDLGLRTNVTYEESDEQKPDRVLRQTPGAGTVEQHSVVNLVIATKPVIKTFKLPNLATKSEADAQTTLSQLDLDWGESQHEESDTVPAGQVVRTDPPAGTEVTAGDTITLVVSSGPPDQGPQTPPGSDGDDGDGGDDGGGGTEPPPPPPSD